MNPNRECGMCGIYDMEPKPMSDLLEVLKPVADGWHTDNWDFETFDVNSEEMQKAMKVLDETTQGCPACKLAALRQSKIPVPCTDFDFKEECAAWWYEFNKEQDVGYY
jgi:hypothetical protein